MTDELQDGILHIQEAYLRLREDQATDDDINLLNTIAEMSLIKRDRAEGLKAGLELLRGRRLEIKAN